MASALIGGAAALMLAGCGLILDEDRQQCAAAADCAKALGGAVEGYTCEEGLCMTTTRCTPETVAQLCGDSPTVQCIDSQCVDPVWGCWSDPDNRAAPTDTIASLNLRFITVFSGPPAELALTACRSATIDPSCAAPLPGATTVYEPSTGLMTVSGITVRPTFAAYRIKADAPASAQLRPIDYYANRPPRNGDPAVDISMIPEALANLVPGETPADRGRATVVVRIFDCRGSTATGAQVTLTEPPADLGIIYVDDVGSVSTTLTATSAQGIASLYNVPVDKAVTVAARITPTRRLTYTVRVFADRHAFVDLYPRIFEGSSAGR